MIRAVLALTLMLSLAACERSGTNATGGGDKPDDETATTPAGAAPAGQAEGRRWPPEGSTGPAPTGPVTATLEAGFDRPGYDIGQIEGLASPEACRQACLDDNLCHAFTWVQAGVQGEQSRCWIKSDVPPQREDACCVSGVVEGRPIDPH